MSDRFDEWLESEMGKRLAPIAALPPAHPAPSYKQGLAGHDRRALKSLLRGALAGTGAKLALGGALAVGAAGGAGLASGIIPNPIAHPPSGVSVPSGPASTSNAGPTSTSDDVRTPDKNANKPATNDSSGAEETNENGNAYGEEAKEACDKTQVTNLGHCVSALVDKALAESGKGPSAANSQGANKSNTGHDDSAGDTASSNANGNGSAHSTAPNNGNNGSPQFTERSGSQPGSAPGAPPMTTPPASDNSKAGEHVSTLPRR